MPYYFAEDGLYFIDDDGVIVMIFRFDNDWSINTVEIDGEIYNAEQGVEDNRILEWEADQPDYGFGVFGTTQVMVFQRQIAFGPMYVICLSDSNDLASPIMLSRVVLYNQPEYAKGEWEIELFDGDEDKEIIYRLKKYNRDDKSYSLLP